MFLDFLESSLNGTEWQRICDSCYRLRYQDEGYTAIPSIIGGDGGIEGFTRTGIVYQCYCPERKYSDDDLYEHLRDKVTKDINKLLDPKYAKRLKDLGVPVIKEWHLVIPEYKDSRILQQVENKKLDVLTEKQTDPDKYSHIDDLGGKHY